MDVGGTFLKDIAAFGRSLVCTVDEYVDEDQKKRKKKDIGREKRNLKLSAHPGA